jgi:nucleoid-associated protein YgaU
MVQQVETGTSLQKQADIFEQDLRKRYPHFSDAQVESMRAAYEDTIIENVTGAQIDTEKLPSQVNLDSKTIHSEKNKQRLAEISELVKDSSLSENMKDSDEYKESKETIVLLTVKNGDTLGDIAKRNYGEPSMYIAIYDANKDKLKSPNSVPVGITLIVPVIDNTNKAKFQALLKKYEAKQKR